jgi:hypothetical protein
LPFPLRALPESPTLNWLPAQATAKGDPFYDFLHSKSHNLLSPLLQTNVHKAE